MMILHLSVLMTLSSAIVMMVHKFFDREAPLALTNPVKFNLFVWTTASFNKF